MMLLRTLVLERSGEDAPVNGALLCGFAVAQSDSNFLVYSLDEEVEPGNSRVYIAALRKKLDRYFLGGVESTEDLQVAMQVFKQILMTAAASGTKTGAVIEASIDFHFIDLKGCKLPPARPEDHHSMIIKKALVMKVITLGMSAPVLPAIESAALIVPSIRFSSQMVSPPKITRQPKPAEQSVREFVMAEPMEAPIAIAQTVEQVEFNEPPPAPPRPPAPLKLPAPAEHVSLHEVDSTLTSLAKIAQDLTQQKRAVVEREEMLEQWQARLEQTQGELEEKSRELAQRGTQLQNQTAEVAHKTEKMTLAMTHLSAMRQRLHGALVELDQALEG
ncbi:hypothetical protein [Pseudomonas sp. ICMP 460]|uniref:hypothetical protein n=1 Tax=Pseudomonas sp. ICMP 460 TaxID=1718917 RepID=UPI000C076056|nr:hypothetical protein [Pseudomonas sp. ICMP 460]PHN21799.1 hypothetical protein AO240_19620 [Pseudomonas sp. ICMP 460]